MPDTPHETPAELLDNPGWTTREPIPRREDDRTFFARCTAFAKEAGAVILFIGLLITSTGAVMTVMGFRVSGTTEAVAIVARSDSALAVRVGRLETRADRVDRSLQFLGYLACVQRTSHDPIAQRKCITIIADMQALGAP